MLRTNSAGALAASLLGAVGVACLTVILPLVVLGVYSRFWSGALGMVAGIVYLGVSLHSSRSMMLAAPLFVVPIVLRRYYVYSGNERGATAVVVATLTICLAIGVVRAVRWFSR